MAAFAPSAGAAEVQPFSASEHALFVEAVEAFSNGAGDALPDEAWRQISARCGRAPDEVQAHAQWAGGNVRSSSLKSLRQEAVRVACRVPERVMR